MGGRGSGGHRPGSGEKPEETVDLSELPPVVAPPDGASDEVLVVWERLAPLARERRTLTEATRDRFALLCRAMVMEQGMAATIERDGWTYLKVTIDGSGQEHTEVKAHPLISQQRGMMQRIEAGLTAFRLAPVGKPVASKAQEKPKSALERLQAQRRDLHAVS